MRRTLARLRVAVTDRRLLFSVVAVALVVSGVFLVQGADAGTEELTRIEGTWTVDGEFTHQARVKESTELHDANETLESHQVYYTQVAPEFDAVYTVGFDANETEGVDIETNATLVYGASRDGTTYWRETKELASATVSEATSGDSLTTQFTVNVTDVKRRVEEVESDLGASPGETEIRVSFDVSVEGEMGGETRTETLTDKIDVILEDGTYRLKGDGFEEVFENRRTVAIDKEPNPYRTAGGFVAVVAGAVLTLLVVVSSAFPPSSVEEERVRHRKEAKEYDEIVVPTELPEEVREKPVAEVESLADLVEVAFNTDSAVIEDTQEERYVVRADGLLYVYEPPSEVR